MHVALFLLSLLPPGSPPSSILQHLLRCWTPQYNLGRHCCKIERHKGSDPGLLHSPSSPDDCHIKWGYLKAKPQSDVMDRLILVPIPSHNLWSQWIPLNVHMFSCWGDLPELQYVLGCVASPKINNCWWLVMPIPQLVWAAFERKSLAMRRQALYVLI